MMYEVQNINEAVNRLAKEGIEKSLNLFFYSFCADYVVNTYTVHISYTVYCFHILHCFPYTYNQLLITQARLPPTERERDRERLCCSSNSQCEHQQQCTLRNLKLAPALHLTGKNTL